MNLAELNKVAEAMVAPGRGILAADELTGTIKKRFDAIGVESDADSRRDYRELLFRTPKRCRSTFPASSCTTRPSGRTPRTARRSSRSSSKRARSPGIKVDKGTKPLPFCPGEVITEGLDGLRERLVEYRGLGAQVRQVARGDRHRRRHPELRLPSRPTRTRSRATRRSARNEDIVPIVEPEVLMDGDHDIDRCDEVTEWLLKTVFEQLYYQRVALEGMVLKPNMVVPGKKSAKQASVEEVAEKTRARAQGLRAGGGARHRIPVRRPVATRKRPRISTP